MGPRPFTFARDRVTIPFENIDPLLGNPVPLDLDSLYGKLVNAFNRRITRRYADGRIEEFGLRDPGELARVFERDFAIEPPTEVETLFTHLPAHRR